uniref:DNA topoisomerase I n=1 Tax=Strongyloides papillosus TaxID=174720 RepID=A0A0N5BN14_STREA
MTATIASSPMSSGCQNISIRTYSDDCHMKDVNELKKEDLSEDDIPWSQRVVKGERKGENKKPKEQKKKRKKDSDEEDEYIPEKKNKKEKKVKEVKEEVMTPVKEKKSKKKSKTNEVKEEKESPKKRKKGKQEEEEEVWKWWEEEKKPEGVKWNTLHHNGPMFAPPYERLPEDVVFRYNGKVMKLSDEAEEVATFYARMIGHEYTEKEAFNTNFMNDWQSVMTEKEKGIITNLEKCDFSSMTRHFQELTEARKAMSKEEKQVLKDQKEVEVKKYGYAYIDGHKQKIGNFRIEPPGLFRGRGGHPKMGKLKRRVLPEDVIINCSKDKIPEPPAGHRWKEVRHDNTVAWLVCWTENVLGNNKYIMLNPSSKLKGEKDFEKFETARRLKTKIDEIRKAYRADWKSKEMRIRQRAVALYFIDKLALRAGNEKDVDEAADTVGCCSLRCEHIKLHDELDGKQYVVEFDFLGKDSIRYFNQVPVEKTVYKNLKIFMENKDPNDDLFDRLDTTTLNSHLQTLMPGLTVKVFRTYNASFTLQDQLMKLSNKDDTIHDKLLSYNRANRQVAILCNHQRAVPKTHEKSMENLATKIKEKKSELKKAKTALSEASGKEKEKLEKKVARVKEQLRKLKIQRTDKDENKQIALSTSKLNYLDPRITVAWCKKMDVPLEKVFSKTHREKFQWAIDMADEDYEF